MSGIRIDINICRVCLQSTPGCSIFSDDILEKFRFTTLVHIQQHDGMPELLCKKCLARLRVAYDFKKQAEASDEHLRTFISDVNQKFQQVTQVETKAELIDDDGFMLDADILEYDELGDLDTATAIQIIAADTVDENYDNSPQQMEMLIMNDEDVPYAVDNLDDDDEQPLYGQTDDDSLNDADQMFEEEEHLDETCMDTDPIVAGPSTNVKPVKASTKKVSSSSSSGGGSGESSGRRKRHFCTKCDKEFSTGTNLTRHMISHDGYKPYVCTICGGAFTQNGSLKSHMFIHTGERPFKCNVCEKGFTQSKSLTFHMRRHTGEKPYECDLCGMKFRQKDGLKRHENSKHASAPHKQYPCEICHKVLHSKYSLKFHMTKHADSKQPTTFQCDECGKVLQSAKSLSRHRCRLNTEGSEFKCTSCDFTSKTKAVLNAHQEMEHQNVQTDEITFSCADCDEDFDSLDLYEEHSKKTGHNPGQITNENEFDF